MKIGIVRPFLPGIEEIKEDFGECLHTGMVTNNLKHVTSYEQKLKEYLNSSFSPVAYCNGELALFNLILAWKQKLGYSVHDSFEVLVPSFTFSGTVNAILMNNLTPVFCDIDETLTLNPEKAGQLPENTKMVIAVGVYGNLPDINQLKQYANENNLVLLFDNAPAFGATYNGYFPSQYNINEIYSFHATKIYSTMEGGAALTNDREIHGYLFQLRDFGQFDKSTGDVNIPGLNSKMQEISAIIGKTNLEKIDYILDQRKKNIALYLEFFKDLEKKGHIQTMKVAENVFCPYLYFPLILNEEATSFINYMDKHEISVRRYYTAVHTLKLYKNKYKELDLNFTNAIKDRIVALPIHTEMNENEIQYLFDTINHYFMNQKNEL